MGPIKPRKPTKATPPLDALKVAKNMHPFEYERYILGNLVTSQVINISVINDTKQKLDLTEVRQKMALMPQLSARMGSVRLRYNIRLAKGPTDNIGGTDIVIFLKEDDRTYVYNADTKRPKTFDLKVNVHIPNSIINLVMRKALAFVEPLDLKLTEEARLNAVFADNIARASLAFKTGFDEFGNQINRPAYRNPVQYGHQQAIASDGDDFTTHRAKQAENYAWLDATEKHYNGIRGVNRSAFYAYDNRHLFTNNSYILKPYKLKNSIRKTINPYFRLTHSQLNKHLDWMNKSLKLSTGDAELLPFEHSRGSHKLAKGVGLLGDGLTAYLIYNKFNTNTYTASTYVDTALLALSLYAAIAAIPIIGWICFGYGVVNYISNGYLSQIWDTLFPVNSPLPPLTYTSYVRF